MTTSTKLDKLIDGELLVAEIAEAVGVNIANHYGVTSSGTLEITGFDEYATQIKAVIDAHNPDMLGVCKSSAISQVDAIAETVRHRFITQGSGQALVYQSKREEHQRYVQTVADKAEIEAADFPIAAVEMAAWGYTLEQTIQMYGELMAQWGQVAAVIEGVRLGAKLAIAKAGTQPEIEAILAGLTWPEAE